MIIPAMGRTLDLTRYLEWIKADYARFWAHTDRGITDYGLGQINAFNNSLHVEERRNYAHVWHGSTSHTWIITRLAPKLEAKGFRVGDILTNRPPTWRTSHQFPIAGTSMT